MSNNTTWKFSDRIKSKASSPRDTSTVSNPSSLSGVRKARRIATSSSTSNTRMGELLTMRLSFRNHRQRRKKRGASSAVAGQPDVSSMGLRGALGHREPNSRSGYFAGCSLAPIISIEDPFEVSRLNHGSNTVDRENNFSRTL